MSPGTGFKSTTTEAKQSKRKKKAMSKGLLFVGIVLAIIIAIWGGLVVFKNKLEVQKRAITDQVISVNNDINSAITPEEADFATRAYAFDDELYRNYDSNDILEEIEKIMILKTSDESKQDGTEGNRTVLKSFQYNAGANTKKTFDDGEATLTGAGSVTITADADTFDVMAQQISAFKDSSYFNNVKVGTTDRDDYNRIIFTLTMDVNGYGTSPYEDYKNSDKADVKNDADSSMSLNDDLAGIDNVNINDYDEGQIDDTIINNDNSEGGTEDEIVGADNIEM